MIDEVANIDQAKASASMTLYRLFAHRCKKPCKWADPMTLDSEMIDCLPEQGDVRTLSNKVYEKLCRRAFIYDRDVPSSLKYFIARVLVPGFASLGTEVSRAEYTRQPLDRQELIEWMIATCWREWPVEEVEAIERFWLLDIEREVSCPLDACGSSDVQDMVIRGLHAGIPQALVLAPLLDHKNRRAIEALGMFARDLAWKGTRYADIRMRWTSKWDTSFSPEAVGRLVEALTNPAVIERLEDQFFATTDRDDQVMLSATVLHLELLSSSKKTWEAGEF